MDVALQTGCWGFCRNDDREQWESAYFDLTDDWLDIHPRSVTSSPADSAVRVHLTEISNLAQLEAADATHLVVQLTTVDDAGFDAIVDQQFVEALCSALVAVSRREVADDEDDSVVISLVDHQPIVGATPSIGPAPTIGVTPLAPATGPASASSPRRRALIIGAAALVFAITAGLAVNNWRVARTQTEQAERFERSLTTANASLAETENLLTSVQAERTAVTDERDQLSDRLATAEADNKELTTRVTELSNEKAQAQDERNYAAEQARIGAQAGELMLQCRDLILDALSYSLEDSYYLASSTLDRAVPICQQANTLVAELVEATS